MSCVANAQSDREKWRMICCQNPERGGHGGSLLHGRRVLSGGDDDVLESHGGHGGPMQ